MANAKSKYKLKQEKGVLHIGGGRFFYPGESYELTAKELASHGHYFSEEKKAAGKNNDEVTTQEDGSNDSKE